jgi:hypothetical protein
MWLHSSLLPNGSRMDPDGGQFAFKDASTMKARTA